MIKCKEDLKNTYIVNDHGELRDLYISALGRFGVDTCESDEHFLIYEPDDYPHMDTARLGWHNYNNSRRLTLSDLKPRTRTEYVKVTESIFDLRDEFERGELFMKLGDELITVPNETQLSILLDHKQCYRKVEKEIDWRDDVREFLESCRQISNSSQLESFTYKGGCSDKNVQIENELHDNEFLELCRVALRANGEI